jgi:hypothetical protein
MAPPHNESGGDRQFVGGQKKGFSRSLLWNPFHLIENSARTDNRHPVFGWPLSLSHPGLRRFFCDRLIRKDPNPDSTCPLDESRHSNTGGFNLAGAQPTTFGGLKPEVAKVEFIPAGSSPSHFPLLHLAIFRFLRHQHNTSSPWKNGMLEEWNIEFESFNYFSIIPIFRYSTIPLFA